MSNRLGAIKHARADFHVDETLAFVGISIRIPDAGSVAMKRPPKMHYVKHASHERSPGLKTWSCFIFYRVQR